MRRAFLCGTDAVSGRCFDHRKQWIQERLEFLARNLAVDVLGFSMRFSEYLQLLDWTGRQVRTDKRGEIPQELAPILERMQISGESWLKLVHDFRRKFRRAAGTPASLLKEAQKRGCRKMQGIIHSRAIFEPPAPRSTA